jgi:hypothetical protein
VQPYDISEAATTNSFLTRGLSRTLAAPFGTTTSGRIRTASPRLLPLPRLDFLTWLGGTWRRSARAAGTLLQQSALPDGIAHVRQKSGPAVERRPRIGVPLSTGICCVTWTGRCRTVLSRAPGSNDSLRAQIAVPD